AASDVMYLLGSPGGVRYARHSKDSLRAVAADTVWHPAKAPDGEMFSRFDGRAVLERARTSRVVGRRRHRLGPSRLPAGVRVLSQRRASPARTAAPSAAAPFFYHHSPHGPCRNARLPRDVYRREDFVGSGRVSIQILAPGIFRNRYATRGDGGRSRF